MSEEGERLQGSSCPLAPWKLAPVWLAYPGRILFAVCLATPEAGKALGQGKQPLHFRRDVCTLLCPSAVEKPCTMPRPSTCPHKDLFPHPRPGGLEGKAKKQVQDIFPVEQRCTETAMICRTPNLLICCPSICFRNNILSSNDFSTVIIISNDRLLRA